MLRALTLCSLLALPALGGLGGCAADRQAMRKDSDEQADLGQRAELYWSSVRWGDTATAAAFVGDGDTRLRYQQWLDQEREKLRYSDVKILRVELHNPPSQPATTADGSRILRRATVVVRTEVYRLPAQLLEEQTQAQEWVRTEDAWLVEWSDG